jgi:hypothetical protein
MFGQLRRAAEIERMRILWPADAISYKVPERAVSTACRAAGGGRCSAEYRESSFRRTFSRHDFGRNNQGGGRAISGIGRWGIKAYGFNPCTATEEESNTEHGNDERPRVEELGRGPRILFDVVAAVAAK